MPQIRLLKLRPSQIICGLKVIILTARPSQRIELKLEGKIFVRHAPVCLLEL